MKNFILKNKGKFTSTRQENSRIFGLDILRFLAISFVLIDHTYNYIKPENNTMPIGFYFGFLGVELFFVLSGFLIGAILIKTFNQFNKIEFSQIKNFWIRRWFRTLPNYYLMLFVYLVVDSINHSRFLFLNASYWAYVVFLQNAFTIHPAFFATAWSLSIEEWFYVLFPIVLFFVQKMFHKSKRYSVVWTILIFTSVCLFLRVILMLSTDLDWDLGFRKLVPLRLDAIAIGVGFAFIKKQNETQWRAKKNKALLVGIVMIGLLSFAFFQAHSSNNTGNIFLKTLFFSLVSLALGLILCYFDALKTTKNRFFYTIITHISLISYSMYLTHWLIVKVIDAPYFKAVNSIHKFMIVWVSTIIVASVQYRYFEKPMTALREKFTNLGQE